jgi:iron complex outermembrane receptor protein
MAADEVVALPVVVRTGFRAPTLPDLFTDPLTSGFTRLSFHDPLRCPFTRLLSIATRLFQRCPAAIPISRAGEVGAVQRRHRLGAVTGFSVDVDYWKINKSRTIGALTEAQLFNNFDQFADANFIRGPVEPAFPTLPGPIKSIFQGRQNLGNLRASGVDVG